MKVFKGTPMVYDKNFLCRFRAVQVSPTIPQYSGGPVASKHFSAEKKVTVPMLKFHHYCISMLAAEEFCLEGPTMHNAKVFLDKSCDEITIGAIQNIHIRTT